MAYGVTISCDDMVVNVGGQEHRPRQGQTITIRPSLPLGLSRRLDEFRRDLLRMPDNPDVSRVDSTYEEIEKILSTVIVAWTWTGVDGSVLPIPGDDPNVVEDELSLDDFTWIMNQYGELQAEGDEKKADA